MSIKRLHEWESINETSYDACWAPVANAIVRAHRCNRSHQRSLVNHCWFGGGRASALDSFEFSEGTLLGGGSYMSSGTISSTGRGISSTSGTSWGWILSRGGAFCEPDPSACNPSFLPLIGAWYRRSSRRDMQRIPWRALAVLWPQS